MSPGTPRASAVDAWTDQDPVVLDRLRDTGRWHADGRRVPHAMRPAFTWMRRQMRERVAGAKGRPLIWLNVAPTLGRHELCDWSCARGGDVCDKTHLTPGKALLRVRVPAERVLLSDFRLWDQYVVRYQYVPDDPDDAARWDRKVRRTLGGERDGPTPQVSSAWPTKLIHGLVTSWERIFDVGPGRPTQGTIEHVDLSEVVDTVAAPRLDDVPTWLLAPPGVPTGARAEGSPSWQHTLDPTAQPIEPALAPRTDALKVARWTAGAVE